MNITEKLKELGYSTVPEKFYTKVQERKSWYVGDVKGCHRYKVHNGTSVVRCKRYTLNMGKKIPEDWANLLMNERVEITLEGQREQDYRQNAVCSTFSSFYYTAFALLVL